MGLAETAELVTRLSLKDDLTGPLAKAEAGVAKVGKTASGTATKGMSDLEKKTKGVGNAFAHASGQAKGFFTGITGFVGAGALLGVGIFLNKSVQEAAEFGANVSKVAKVTGLANGTASAMVDTLDKWGVSADRILPLLGRMEKNLGMIADSKGGTKAFFDQYGVSLTDTHGKLLDANTLLLKSADYFNGQASAADKATFMSKLWGKAWQDLIPILSKGSTFLKAQEADSIHLTDTQISNIAKFRDAQRDFADAFGDVQVKIGTELMPLITGALKDVSTWLDTHGDEIAQFFHDAADFAGQAASAVGMVFGALKTGWDSVPKPLRDLLVTGLVADKTIKFLFGFDPAKMLLGGLGKGLFSRGGTPANPLFVTDVTGGKGGLPGIAKLGPEGLLAALGITTASLTILAAGIGAAAVGAIVLDAAINAKGGLQNALIPVQQGGGALGPAITAQDPGVVGPRTVAYGRGPALTLNPDFSGGTLPGQSPVGATRDMDKIWSASNLNAAATNRLTAAMRNPKWLSTLEAVWHKQGDVTRAQLEVARADLVNGRNLAKAAEFIGGAKGAGTGGPEQIRADIHDLRKALKSTYDPTETKAITHAIHELRDKLPKVSDNHKILDKAEKIATSTEATKEKIADLKGLLKDVDSKGLRGKLQDIISKVPRATDKTTKKVDDAGRKIDNTKTAVQSGARTNAAATRTASGATTRALSAMTSQIVAALYATQSIVNVTAADVTAAQTRRNRGGPGSGSAAGHSGGGRVGNVPG